MISITWNHTRVEATVETGLYNNKEVIFVAECSNPMFAELLATRLNGQMEKLIEDIRKTEYEAGYADAKGKKKKRKFFWCVLRDEKYGTNENKELLEALDNVLANTAWHRIEKNALDKALELINKHKGTNYKRT